MWLRHSCLLLLTPLSLQISFPASKLSKDTPCTSIEILSNSLSNSLTCAPSTHLISPVTHCLLHRRWIISYICCSRLRSTCFRFWVGSFPLRSYSADSYCLPDTHRILFWVTQTLFEWLCSCSFLLGISHLFRCRSLKSARESMSQLICSHLLVIGFFFRGGGLGRLSSLFISSCILSFSLWTYSISLAMLSNLIIFFLFSSSMNRDLNESFSHSFLYILLSFRS